MLYSPLILVATLVGQAFAQRGGNQGFGHGSGSGPAHGTGQNSGPSNPGSLDSLSSVLDSEGISLATNGNRHGAPLGFQNRSPFTFPEVNPSPSRYGHDIHWHRGVNGGDFIDWRTFKANGVNLGSWLEKEKVHDPIWWDSLGAAAALTNDEWSLCEALGPSCGPIFEARYASFLNKTTIDQLASVGVNTLRIPTTYAAWINVPGSQLWHGNQQIWLRSITQYAIEKYNMHVIIGLHSLPGGVNNLDIGEAIGHDAWFFNATNLRYSFLAVNQVLNFMRDSGHLNAFTIAPINEASNNLTGFGSPTGLTEDGVNWITTYINGVLRLAANVDRRIPVMLQDNFEGASFWAPLFPASSNLVIDSHVYYFAAAGAYANYINPAVCGQAQYLADETTFPTFVGEWSLQSKYNNTLAVENRTSIFDTQRYAWQEYVSGGAFWTAVSYSTTPVDGEGVQRDYWSYIDLINEGVIRRQTTASYC